MRGNTEEMVARSSGPQLLPGEQTALASPAPRPDVVGAGRVGWGGWVRGRRLFTRTHTTPTSSETFPGSSQSTDDKLTPTCSRVYSPFGVRPSMIRTWRCVRTPGTSPKCHRHSLRRAQQEPTCSGPRSRLGRQPLAARTGQQDHGKGLAWPQETPCYGRL